MGSSCSSLMRKAHSHERGNRATTPIGSTVGLALPSKIYEYRGGDPFLVLVMGVIGVALSPAAFAVGPPIAYGLRREWIGGRSHMILIMLAAKRLG